MQRSIGIKVNLTHATVNKMSVIYLYLAQSILLGGYKSVPYYLNHFSLISTDSEKRFSFSVHKTLHFHIYYLFS